MASGSGVGTPIGGGLAPDVIPDGWPNCALSLSRYASLIGYDECAFWGVRYDGQEQFACSTFWTEWQRQMVADALAQAQQMLEDMLGYPLCPTWIVGDIPAEGDARYVDQQPFFGNPVITSWAQVLAAGVRAESTIQDDAIVDYSVEPAKIGPFTTTLTSASEAVMRFQDSDRAITPTHAIYSGGVLTLYVPRCRLVNPELYGQVTADTGLEKTDLDSFVAAVDVRRVYNDTSTNALLVRSHACSAYCLADGCSSETDAACILIDDAQRGVVHVYPATYSDGWSVTTTGYCHDHVKLNYLAGLRTLSRQLENVMIRLAHSLMPEEPCGCETTQRLWARDRKTSEVLSREMLNCPWGFSAGALFAYAWANQNRLARGGIL